MSKKLLFTVLVAFITAIPLTMFAQTVFPLSESFENGIPDTWTMEYSGVGEAQRIAWVAEKGDVYAYPIGATSGVMRAAFRNTTGVETKGHTMLVSPVFDPSDLANPVLCFAHATPRVAGVFDTLYVKYRNVINGDEKWLNLARFTLHANTWQTDTIDLVAWSSKYQIAFEAVDHLGRGVVIDNVVVRSRPQCMAPYALSVENVTESSADLVWGAGFSQDAFEIMLSSRELLDYEIKDADFVPDMGKKTVDGGELIYKLTGLNPGQYVYWYVRTICSGEATEWVRGNEVSIPNRIAIPFTQNFNIDECEEETDPSRPNNWYWGSSLGNNIPSINCYTYQWNLSNTSKDNSFSLVFGINSGRGWSGNFDALDAGEWAYIATPEIIVDHISLVQLKFDAAYANTDKSLGGQILVGVMTNPTDVKTFTLVQTVNLPIEDSDFAVSFAGYEGDAKNIAIMSRSDKPNRFAIDNINVSLSPACPKARNVEFRYPSSDQVVVDWNSATATAGQIYIASTRISEAQLETSTDVIRKINATEIPFVVTNNGVDEASKLVAGQTYYVFTRNSCGEAYGAWSASATMTMPAVVTELPQSDMKTIFADELTILPELSGIDIKDVEVKYVAEGSAVVGILDTVGSISSFTFIEQTSGDKSIRRTTFDNYIGKGRFIALKGTVSDIELRYKTTCTLPENLDADPTHNSVNLSWRGSANAQFEVIVSRTDDYKNLEKPEYTGYIYRHTIDEANVTIADLQPNTKYYFWVRSVCADADDAQKTSYSEWSLTSSFKTLCSPKNKLPYILDIDNAQWSGILDENCVATVEFNGYPAVGDPYWGMPAGYKNAITMQTFSYNASQPNIYMIFDEMDIDNIKNLLLTFQMANKTSSYKLEECPLSLQRLEIGVMKYKDDTTTFVKVAEVHNTDVTSTSRSFAEDFAVSFNSYEGDGKYVAIRAPREIDVNFLIFDVRFDVNSGCSKVETPQLVDVSSDGAKISWRKSLAETEWQMVAADSRLDNDQLTEAIALTDFTSPTTLASAAKVFAVDNAVKTNVNYTLAGLLPQTDIYVYVRSNCGEAYSPWSNPLQFTTNCGAANPEELGVIDFEVNYFEKCNTRPDCWTLINNMDNKKWGPVISDETAYSGRYSLKIASALSTNSDEYSVSYAIMPELNVEDISDYRMTFFGTSGTPDFSEMAMYNACQQPQLPRADRIIVGVTSSLKDLSRFIAVDTIFASSMWQPYTVSFADYEGDDYAKGKYVVFMSEFEMNNVFYIDDISFVKNESTRCLAPIYVDTTAAAGSSIDLVWQEGTAPFAVRLATRQLSDTELTMTSVAGVTAIDAINDHKTTLEGLEIGQQYYAYVASSCGGENVWSSPLRFSLQCPANYALPYICNFDNEVAGMAMMPNCWTGIYSQYDEMNKYPYVSSEGVSGNGLFVYTKNGSTFSYAILPALATADLTKCVVSFDAKGDRTDLQRSVVVGVVTDLSPDIDISVSYIPVDTVTLIGSDYQHFTVSLASNTPSAKRIVLTSAYDANQHISNGTMGYPGGAYIDNIVVSLGDACPMPQSVRVTAVTATTASISVDGSATEYALVAGSHGFRPAAKDAVKIASTHTLNISGLTDIYVANYCNGVAGDLMFGPLTIRPVDETMVDATQGVVDNMDDASLWSRGDVTSTPNYWAVDAVREEDNPALFVTMDGTTAKYNTGAMSNLWAYRSLNLKPGLYTISYKKMADAQTETNFLRFGLLPATSSFVDGSARIMDATGKQTTMSLTATPKGWINLSVDDKKLTSLTDITLELVVKNDMAGIYNLVAYWQNDNSGVATAPSAIIDNIDIAYQPCAAPYDLTMDKLTYNSASLAWSELVVEGINRIGFEVFATSDVDALSPATVGDNYFSHTYKNITATTTSLTELPVNTSLKVFVRERCSDEVDGYSPWSLPIEFNTLCDYQDTTALRYDFERMSDLIPMDEIQYSWQSHEVFRPECFVIGHINGKDPVDFAPMVFDPSSWVLARSGQYCLSLNRVSGISSKDAGGYVALPLMEGDYTGMQMVFWMRGVVASSDWQTGGTMFYDPKSYADPNVNAASITLCTMTDPNDPTTIEKVRVYKYPYTEQDINANVRPSDDPNGNEFWVKYVVPLEKFSGKYIAFLNDDYGVSTNKVYIDDISFEPYNGCMQPQNLRPTRITSDSVAMTFDYEVGDTWEVVVSSMRNMKDTLLIKTINDNNFTITGLKQNTKYFITVRQNCGEGLFSDASMVTTIETLRGLRYQESFSKDVRDPEGWQRTNGTINLVDLLKGNVNMFTNINMSHANGWQHAELSESMSAHQIYTVTESPITSTSYWDILPPVYIRDGEQANVTLDLAVTMIGSADPLLEAEINSEDVVFVLAVSTDEGKTYLRENAFVWSNNKYDNPDFKFSDITNKLSRFTVDISKHVNTKVFIAFTAISNSADVAFDMHVDNIIVNTTEVIEIEESLCGRQDYVGYGFDIPYETLKVGEVYKEERFDLAEDNGSDRLYKLTLTTESPIEKVEEVTVCESALPYTDKNGFVINEAGIYARRFEREGKCDSTYKINLSVTPTIRTFVSDSICNGGSYTFGDQLLTTAGTYNATFTSTVTNCDSVVVLSLKLMGAKEYPDTVILCYGETYMFGNRELAATGNYKETFYADGCDSVVNLRLEVRPEYIDIKNVAICQGDTYTDDVFKGIKTNFCDTLMRKSVDGCDSIVGLELVVIDGEEVIDVEKNITRNDLPYTYFGHTFDTNTKDGTSIVNIPIKAEGDKCSGMIRLTLNVGDATGDAVDVARIGLLNITPNPVHRGEKVRVALELSTADLYGTVVSVFDLTGAEVSRIVSPSKPITIVCDFPSGVYVVRITLATGELYQGKIIVK